MRSQAQVRPRIETPPTGAPTVSVVIPTYNRAHVVGRAIRSVLAQTFPDLECIVVDDRSSDDTVHVVEGFQDPRIRLLRLAANSGAGRARNEGIQAARGELVAFLDSDDEWLPRKLELQVTRLRASVNPRITTAYCRWYVYDGLKGRMILPTLVIHEGDVLDHLLSGWHPRTMSLFVVTRSSLLTVGGFHEGLRSTQDYDLWLRLAEASNHFVAVDEPLVVKYDNAGPQIRGNPTLRFRAQGVLSRKWRPVIERRLGPAGFRRWKTRRYEHIQRVYFRRVRQAAVQGDRLAAWRYALGMCRLLPWARRNVIHALALATLGHSLYKALERAKNAVVWRLGGPPPAAS